MNMEMFSSSHVLLNQKLPSLHHDCLLSEREVAFFLKGAIYFAGRDNRDRVREDGGGSNEGVNALEIPSVIKAKLIMVVQKVKTTTNGAIVVQERMLSVHNKVGQIQGVLKHKML